MPESAPPPETIEIITKSGPVRISILMSPRARRIALKTRSAKGDIALIVPKNGSVEQAIAFARSKAGWLASRQAKMPEAIPFQVGELIPIRGELHEICALGKSRGQVKIRENPDWVGDPKQILVPGDELHIGRRLTDWLKREAKSDLSKAVAIYTLRAGVTHTSITIRDTTSRWGSCSSAGRLNFSWRMILAPPFVLEYLAAHEVAHLKHMNHSHRFWNLVAKIEPDFEKAEHWLKQNGAKLHRYG